jgi:polyphosphate kinase
MMKVGIGMPHKYENGYPVQSQYINRDLSWLEFNRRVLEEAQDPTTPLVERLKFLSIVSTNLDEFMSVRVAGIQEQWKVGYNKKDFSGYTPSGLLKRIVKRTTKLVADQYKSYRELLRQAAREGIHFLDYDDLNVTQKKNADQYYHEIIFPVLTPMAVDQSRPFPLVHNHGLYLSVVLRKEDEADAEDPYFSIVQVPSILSRFIELPRRNNSKKQEFILLEQVISQHIHTLFSGYIPLAVHQFRVTRNADLPLNEEGAEDLLEQIEKELRRRRWGVPIRLEVERGIHPYALEMLTEEFEIDDRIFEIDGPLDLSYLMKFTESLTKVDHLRHKRIEPVYPAPLTDHSDFFEVLRQQDVLVFHPYESFEAILDFIDQAANDANVLAIKMTLYRVSGNSSLIRSLMQAAEAGKQVTVVVELKARFDEERNIAWAKELEKAGCHVVYGLAGLKTHAKITLVVRQEHGILERYVHVGTGNYNENTARHYTDLGLFTANPEIGEDASVLFNEITGYSSPREWRQVAVAPTGLQDKLCELIRREIAWAAKGKPSRIIAKINSLSSQLLVDELYTASQAGVKIELIVRGICCLRPGVPGLSENISVISIVDRYLEHTRLFYFENGGKPDVWLSSADWMTRNLTRRIELMCPVLDPSLKQYVIQILRGSLRDNVKARRLTDKAIYERTTIEGETPYRSQFAFNDIHSWKS